MKCPACETNDLLENSEICPACGFKLADLDKLLGMPPHLHPGVNDLIGVLESSDRNKLKEKVVCLGLQFPQCRFAVVLVDSSSKVPLPLLAFWLFNRGGAVAPMEKQGDCRLVMLVMELQSSSAVCMVGYGLEPFIKEEHLQRVTESCRPALKAAEYTEAIISGLDEIAAILEQSVEDIPQAFGLQPEGEENLEDSEESYVY